MANDGAAVSAETPEALRLPADLFATPEMHQQFMSLSHLNAKLDGLVPREKGATLLHLTGDDDKGLHRGSFEYQQETLADLLVRDNEVIAAILASLTTPVPQGNPQDPSAFTRVLKPEIIIAANPRRDDFKKLEKDNKLPQSNVRVDALRLGDSRKLDISRGVVEAVLEKHKSEDGHVLFHIHVGWFIGLLKDCHHADPSTASYATAKEAFSTYVYLVSYPKMKSRMEIGMKKSNFWNVLTKRPNEWPVNPFEDGIDEELLKIMPSSRQVQFMQHFISKMPGDANTKANYSSTVSARPLYDIEGRKFFHGMMSTLLTTTYTALKELSTFMGELKKKDWAYADGDVKAVETLVKTAKVEMATLSQFLDYFGPAALRDVDLLSAHLTWLAQKAEVNGRTDDSVFAPNRTIATAETSSAQAPAEAGGASLQTPFAAASTMSALPVLGNQQSTEETQTAIEREDESQVKGADEESPVKGADEESQVGGADGEPSGGDETTDDNVQLQELAEGVSHLGIAGSGWASAALKYIGLACLHELGLSEACPTERDATKSDHVRNAMVTVVDITTAEWHDKRNNFRTTLSLLREDDDPVSRYEGLLTKSKTDSLQEKYDRRDKNAGTRTVKQQEGIEKERATEIKDAEDTILDDDDLFSGTMHCETILMAAMVLLKTAPQLEQNIDDDKWLERNGLFGLKATLLSLLRFPLPLLTVSKRCCPACWKVFELLKENKVIEPNSKWAVPGYHTKWFAVRLPPFLPKSYVEACIESAKKEAKVKLQKLEAIIKKEKKDGSSPASNEASTKKKKAAAPYEVPYGDTPDQKRQSSRLSLSDLPSSSPSKLGSMAAPPPTPLERQPGASPSKVRRRETEEATEEERERTGREDKFAEEDSTMDEGN